MTSVPVPTYDNLMQPTMDALRACGGQASNDEITARVVLALGLLPETVSQPHKEGRDLTELEYRLMWTRTYLRHFGLIDSPQRGVWRLTETGWQTTSLNTREIVRTVRSRLDAARQVQDGQAPFDIEAVVLPTTESPEPSSGEVLRSPTPLFPTYTNARHRIG